MPAIKKSYRLGRSISMKLNSLCVRLRLCNALKNPLLRGLNKGFLSSFSMSGGASGLNPDPLISDPLPKQTILADVPLPFGLKPRTIRTSTPIPPQMPSEHMSYVSISNVVWCILVGSWLSLFFAICGVVCYATLICWRYGSICFELSRYVFYPFGKYIYLEESAPPNFFARFFFCFFSLVCTIPLAGGMLLSWELIYFIPMFKALLKLFTLIYTKAHQIRIANLEHHNPTNGRLPVVVTYYSGSRFYFHYTVMQMEVVYINLFPFVILALYLGFLAPSSSKLREPVTGSFISLIATIPCMYVIGVCTEVLSSRTGLVIGSLINAGTTGLVELILFYFSIKQGMVEVVRAAVTGAFLMNLLVIPGLSMLAAGLKWKEVKLNKKVQSVSGTILFLAIVAVFFPAIFYNLYEHEAIYCQTCSNVTGNFLLQKGMNCTQCSHTKIDNLDDDVVYTTMARPLMYTVSIVMPIVYAVGLIFSLKTHKYIYDQFEKEQAQEESNQTMGTVACVVLMAICTVLYSVISDVLTDRMPGALDKMHLTERFVGLVFYTLIPDIAEFINAVRFALEGNMGLSLELGNQGAMCCSLIQMPALVLMSVIIGDPNSSGTFTLMFEMIDVFAVIISVLLRNSMLSEGGTNYFTGFAFLVIFSLISVVYYFDPW